MIHRLPITSVCLLLFVAAAAHAAPFTFNFTGHVSDQILQSGMLQPSYTSNSAWLGMSLSGTLTLDLDNVPASPTNVPGMTGYGATQDYPDASWISATVTNPDGSIVNIATSVQPHPLPVAEGNDAYTLLRHFTEDGSFYAQRTYTNLVSFPQQQFFLALRAVGPAAPLLTSSDDYADVVINAGAANYENFGYVRNYTAEDEGYEYGFTIDTVTRAPADVAEPSSWALATLAAGSLLFARRRRIHSARRA